jgi:hypothetical protein
MIFCICSQVSMMLPIEFLFWVLKLDMLHDRYLEHQESARGFNPLHHVNIEESIGCHKIVLYWQSYMFSLNTSCKSEGILLLLPSDDKTTLVYSAYQLECWWWKVIICIGFVQRKLCWIQISW